MKKCPYCAELIQGEAIVCRYCGRDIGNTITAPISEQINNIFSPKFELGKKQLTEEDFWYLTDCCKESYQLTGEQEQLVISDAFRFFYLVYYGTSMDIHSLSTLYYPVNSLTESLCLMLFIIGAEGGPISSGNDDIELGSYSLICFYLTFIFSTLFKLFKEKKFSEDLLKSKVLYIKKVAANLPSFLIASGRLQHNKLDRTKTYQGLTPFVIELKRMSASL